MIVQILRAENSVLAKAKSAFETVTLARPSIEWQRYGRLSPQIDAGELSGLGDRVAFDDALPCTYAPPTMNSLQASVVDALGAAS